MLKGVDRPHSAKGVGTARVGGISVEILRQRVGCQSAHTIAIALTNGIGWITHVVTAAASILALQRSMRDRYRKRVDKWRYVDTRVIRGSYLPTTGYYVDLELLVLVLLYRFPKKEPPSASSRQPE